MQNPEQHFQHQDHHNIESINRMSVMPRDSLKNLKSEKVTPMKKKKQSKENEKWHQVEDTSGRVHHNQKLKQLKHSQSQAQSVQQSGKKQKQVLEHQKQVLLSMSNSTMALQSTQADSNLKFQKSLLDDLQRKQPHALDPQKLKKAEEKTPHYNFDCLDILDENKLKKEFYDFKEKRSSQRNSLTNKQALNPEYCNDHKSQQQSQINEDQQAQLFDFNQYQLKKNGSQKKVSKVIQNAQGKKIIVTTRNHAQITQQSSLKGKNQNKLQKSGGGTIQSINKQHEVLMHKKSNISIRSIQKEVSMKSLSRNNARSKSTYKNQLKKGGKSYSHSSNDFSSQCITPNETGRLELNHQLSMYESKMFTSPFNEQNQGSMKQLNIDDQLRQHKDLKESIVEVQMENFQDQVEFDVSDIHKESRNSKQTIRNQVRSSLAPSKEEDSIEIESEDYTLIDNKIELKPVDQEHLKQKASNFYCTLGIQTSRDYKQNITKDLKKSPSQTLKSTKSQTRLKNRSRERMSEQPHNTQTLLEIQKYKDQRQSKSRQQQVQKQMSKKSNKVVHVYQPNGNQKFHNNNNFQNGVGSEFLKQQQISMIVQSQNTSIKHVELQGHNSKGKNCILQQNSSTPRLSKTPSKKRCTPGKSPLKQNHQISQIYSKEFRQDTPNKKIAWKQNDKSHHCGSRLSLLQEQDIRTKAQIACQIANRKVGILQDIENFLSQLEPQTSSITPIQTSSSKKDLVSFNKRRISDLSSNNNGRICF